MGLSGPRHIGQRCSGSPSIGTSCSYMSHAGFTQEPVVASSFFFMAVILPPRRQHGSSFRDSTACCLSDRGPPPLAGLAHDALRRMSASGDFPRSGLHRSPSRGSTIPAPPAQTQVRDLSELGSRTGPGITKPAWLSPTERPPTIKRHVRGPFAARSSGPRSELRERREGFSDSVGRRSGRGF